MNLSKAILIASALIIFACKASKKSTKTIASSPPVGPVSTNTPPAKPAPVVSVAKSADGIHAPGNEELSAIQMEYKEVTLEKLQEGYSIYKTGACIQCHSPKNIYKRDVTHWKDIVDDMSQRAGISGPQKDAVYKYVLSIKASQPK